MSIRQYHVGINKEKENPPKVAADFIISNQQIVQGQEVNSVKNPSPLPFSLNLLNPLQWLVLLHALSP